MNEAAPANSVSDAQRIDRWLWCARFFKTRTLAAKFVGDGGVRISRDDRTVRVEKPSATVRSGDTLVFTRNNELKVIAVRACAARRGPAAEARLLYEDRSPPPVPVARAARSPFAREAGAGRPTKRERRALDALKNG